MSAWLLSWVMEQDNDPKQWNLLQNGFRAQTSTQYPKRYQKSRSHQTSSEYVLAESVLRKNGPKFLLDTVQD